MKKYTKAFPPVQSDGAQFWNKEYARGGGHLRLSEKPAEDLLKFIRWWGRTHAGDRSARIASAVDLGCGNGRNLIYLAREYGIRGVGLDISDEAIARARACAKDTSLTFRRGSIAEKLPFADESFDLVLDMMVSHVLRSDERRLLHREVYRILRPGGWYFLKTFLLDGDAHAHEMIARYPADEPNAYLHPKIGVFEHVSTVDEVERELAPLFEIHRIKKSHRHRGKKGPKKRRSMCVYAQKVS